MRSSLLLVLAVTLLLSGCSQQEEVVEEPYIPVSERLEDDYFFGNVVISPVGAFTGYKQTDGRTLLIYPYYDLDNYIVVQGIMISEQDWWKTITADTPVQHREGYDVLQTPSGVSFGYMPVNETTALFFRADNLPLGYLDLYMQAVWSPGT